MINYMNNVRPDNAGRSRSTDGLSSNGPGWSVILIFACMALGFTASAAELERIAATRERDRGELLATQCSVAEGRMEDLGKLLANSGTRLYPLSSAGPLAGETAVIAWNAAEQKGYFFCDNLPVRDASGYELWALRSGEQPVKIATIDARPGASVYPFRTSRDDIGKMRVEVTAGPRSAQSSPVFAGDID